MVLGEASRIALCLITLIWHVRAQCPAGFTEVDPGVCMTLTTIQKTYCGTHSHCYDMGVQQDMRFFVPAKNHLSMLKMLPPTSSAFTGITAFLNRSSDHRQGWRFGDPGLAWYETGPGDTTINWVSGEPSQLEHVVGAYINGLLYGVRQSEFDATHVVCEYSPVPLDAVAGTFQLNWPYKLESLYLNVSSFGCLVTTTASSHAECCHK